MNIDQQVTYLMQGTDYGDASMAKSMENELRERLIEAQKDGRPLKVYCGYDPRTTDLHIGHTVTMRKLRQFQELGHDVYFVIGTYTSLIGDPSDQDKLRPLLSTEQVEWLSELTFADLIKLASNFTIQQFLTRENFRLRWDKNEAVHVHELFYSIMQGYDAHFLNTDVQVGGTDQLFNIMTASRKIMSYFNQKPNIGIILSILPGTDGVVKMSKSLGNHIPLNSTPEDMYGKVMSVPDIAMIQFAELATRWTPNDIEEFTIELKNGSIHPRDAKMKLAYEIVSAFFSNEEADRSQENFINLFQRGDLPEEIQEHRLEIDENVLDLMVDTSLVPSKSQGRRLIDQHGVKFDGTLVTDPMMVINRDGILQVGKRFFLKIRKS